MNKKEQTPLDFFLSGLSIAREISGKYYEKYGHFKLGEDEIHHYNFLYLVPFIEDKNLRAFIAGIALDDLPDLIDVLFKNNEKAKNISDSIREVRGELKHHDSF